jgi:hypothetical protein
MYFTPESVSPVQPDVAEGNRECYILRTDLPPYFEDIHESFN